MIFERLRLLIKMAFRFLKVYIQLLYAAWRLLGVAKPIVSFFGGSRLDKNDVYFDLAMTLSKKLIQHNISVLTGGGPGVMEAANCGLDNNIGLRGSARSIGIGIKDLDGGEPNQCVEEYLTVDYFFARKLLLTSFSTAFVVFPGGYGTLDELSDLLTLMQTKHLDQAPVVLVGKEFWSGMMAWLADEVVEKHRFMTLQELSLIVVSDDVDEIFCLLTKACGVDKS